MSRFPLLFKSGIIALHVLAFCLLAKPAPTDPISVPEPAEAPDPAEVAILEELVEWVGEDPIGPEQATAEPLAETIRQRPQSFELFRSYHAKNERRAQLLGLPFGEAIGRVADRYQIDGLLVAAVIEVESGFDPNAVSHRGAIGLMQVMPSTAGLESNILTEPTANLDFGARYLRRLLDLYEGDLELALAAYNAGPGAVRKFGGLPPYRETRRYVEKVLGVYVGHHRTRWQETDRGELLALL